MRELFTCKPDHPRRTIDTNDGSFRHAFRNCGSNRTIAAPDIKHPLAAGQIDLLDQLPCPLLLCRGTPGIIRGIPPESRYRIMRLASGITTMI